MWFGVYRKLSFFGRLRAAACILLPKRHYSDIPWDQPNGCCAQCGAPLNEYMVGGYRLHDGTFAVSAKSE